MAGVIVRGRTAKLALGTLLGQREQAVNGATCAAVSSLWWPPPVSAVQSERQLSHAAASSSSSARTSSWESWTALAASLAAGALTCSTICSADGAGPEPASERFSLLGFARKQRVFFKYEKRVRDNSPLEKVFDYFASVEKDGVRYMAAADLLRAIVPNYPPSKSTLERAGFLAGERQPTQAQKAGRLRDGFFQQFDVDGDGLISFYEFLLVLTLLSIPEKDIKVIFDVVDLDGNGLIDAEEFWEIMLLLQDMANVHGAKHNVGRMQRFAGVKESGIVLTWFGPDHSKKLRLGEFSEFLTRLHDELVKLEFAHYDVPNKGTIPGTDFGRSLVAAADIKAVDRLLDRVDDLPPQLANASVSRKEFFDMHLLSRKMHTVSTALDFMHQIGRPVTPEEFTKLAKKTVGVALSPTVVAILFHVFGNDKTGELDVGAFLDVMGRRDLKGGRRGPTNSENAAAAPVRWWNCVQQCMADTARVLPPHDME